MARGTPGGTGEWSGASTSAAAARRRSLPQSWGAEAVGRGPEAAGPEAKCSTVVRLGGGFKPGLGLSAKTEWGRQKALAFSEVWGSPGAPGCRTGLVPEN